MRVIVPMASQLARGPVDVEALVKENEILRRQNSELIEIVSAKPIVYAYGASRSSPRLQNTIGRHTVLKYVVSFFCQVNAKGLSHGRKLLMCGYLSKYSERPGSWVAGLMNTQWNTRFFCLYGSLLQYYKTEQDMLGHPRGHIDLEV